MRDALQRRANQVGRINVTVRYGHSGGLWKAATDVIGPRQDFAASQPVTVSLAFSPHRIATQQQLFFGLSHALSLCHAFLPRSPSLRFFSSSLFFSLSFTLPSSHHPLFFIYSCPPFSSQLHSPSSYLACLNSRLTFIPLGLILTLPYLPHHGRLSLISYRARLFAPGCHTLLFQSSPYRNRFRNEHERDQTRCPPCL